VKLLVTALGAAVLVGAGCQSRSHVEADLVLRSCGDVSAGKGWHVLATRNLECASARELIGTFLGPSCLQAQRQAGTPCTVSGYRCREMGLSDDRGQVRCSNSTRLVLATSNR
jgi:hypothetical protein